MSTMTIAETQRGENLKVELRRVIRASRQRVFAAWTDPVELRKWFGPGAISVDAVEMDARPGGKYCLVMKGTIEGKPEEAERRISVDGDYMEVIPNELISYTWRPAWSPGEESRVTVRLRDVEGGTELLLTHERFATVESRDGHERGWTSILGKLASYLEN